ncbi:hypothetical protein CWI84_11730 [Idiomarina tyrosinivorans]|uniref:Uncharacterized protein n=2 Tax=Idiomarina tyrosinivorans TaxID=1445662 RepID=A0A432ZCV8_9GAMM|nr:hypothetical protein CWI84_11730 [Idiomarina tyrosinivorans]
MDQDGSVNFVEVKTGDAGFSPNQSKVIEQVGVDSAGNPQYRIPPDATPSGELMRTLDSRKTGGTLAELGYPNGIPVKVIRTEGVEG